MGPVAHASPASPQHPGASPLPSIASASPNPAYIPPGKIIRNTFYYNCFINFLLFV